MEGNVTFTGVQQAEIIAPKNTMLIILMGILLLS